MTEARVEADPAHSGGHALVRIPGAARALMDPRFRIRRDGYDTAVLGPQGWQGGDALLMPLGAYVEASDLVLRLGPEVVDRLESGIILLAVPAAGFDGIAVWPDIAPSYTGAGRAGIGFAPARAAPPPPVPTPLPPPVQPAPPPFPAAGQSWIDAPTEKPLPPPPPPPPPQDSWIDAPHIAPAPPTYEPPPPPPYVPPAAEATVIQPPGGGDFVLPPVPQEKNSRLPILAGAMVLIWVVIGAGIWWLYLRPTPVAVPRPGPVVIVPPPQPVPAPAPLPTPEPTGRDCSQGTLSEMVACAPNAAALAALAAQKWDAHQYDQALLLFQTAADRGSGAAALRLAQLYDPNTFQRGGPIPRADAREAARYYRTASQAGEAGAAAPREALRQLLQRQASNGDLYAPLTLKDFWP